jgi:Tfp pilus assembly protein PilO
MSSEAVASIPARRPFRLRFSLLALLVLITLACLILGWWQFIHLERQRFIRRRDVFEKHVAELSADLKRKWDDYMDIAKSMGVTVGDGEMNPLQFDLHRLDRLDSEAMRIKNQVYELQGSGKTAELEIRKQQLGELVKEQAQLKAEIQRSAPIPVQLEPLRADLVRQQKLINRLSEELERLNIEAEVRGIPSK